MANHTGRTGKRSITATPGGSACRRFSCGRASSVAGASTPTLTSMPSDEAIAVIEDEGRRIIELGRRAPDAAVPQYPTWTLRDLVIHIGGVHARTADICATLPQDRIPTPEPPADADAFDWAEEQLERMLDGLLTADPEAQVWTFVTDKRLRGWERRMLIETGVHRWDAQGVLGTPEPLLPLVAGHGLDEFPDLYLPRLGDLPAIELTAVDLGCTWRYGGGEPAIIIEGPASELFLRLVSRPGVALPEAWERAIDALPTPAGA